MQPEKIIGENKNIKVIEDDSYWQSHIDTCKKTKLSHKAYCRQQGLAYHRFKYWQNKLKPKTLKAIPVQVQAFKRSDVLCTLKFADGNELLVHDKSALSLVLSRLA